MRQDPITVAAPGYSLVCASHSTIYHHYSSIHTIKGWLARKLWAYQNFFGLVMPRYDHKPTAQAGPKPGLNYQMPT